MVFQGLMTSKVLSPKAGAMLIKGFAKAYHTSVAPKDIPERRNSNRQNFFVNPGSISKFEFEARCKLTEIYLCCIR